MCISELYCTLAMTKKRVAMCEMSDKKGSTDPQHQMKSAMTIADSNAEYKATSKSGMHILVACQVMSPATKR